MLWALGLALFASSHPRAPAPNGTAVVYTPGVAAHHDIAEQIAALDRSVVMVPVGEPWTRAGAPRRLIALGEAAAERVRQQWPKTPRAVALTWDAEDAGAALTVLGRPQAACVVEALASPTQDTRWLVLAAESDALAPAMAAALHAELAQGTPKELQARLRETDTGTAIWLRAHPSLASSVWLQSVPRLLGRGVVVASDAPGLTRFGFASPVEIDLPATAARLVDWSHARRGRNARRLVEELPCGPA